MKNHVYTWLKKNFMESQIMCLQVVILKILPHLLYLLHKIHLYLLHKILLYLPYGFQHFQINHHVWISVYMMKKVFSWLLLLVYYRWIIFKFGISVSILPWPIRRHLKWKLSTITPVVVRKTAVNSGFRIMKEPKDWIGSWGQHMKSVLFKLIPPHQKVNFSSLIFVRCSNRIIFR